MNKILLLGRLTKEPETRFTQTNSSMIVSFTMAVNRKFTKVGEEQQTDFINIVSFGKTAEFIQKYYKKGMQIVIIGRLQTRNWEDDQGKKHYATEVITEETYFADSKKISNSDTSVSNDSLTTEIPLIYENDNITSDDDLPF